MFNNEYPLYTQTKSVSWLPTPEGTIWIKYGYRNYIQLQNETLRSTPLGVDLDLLFDEDETVFKLMSAPEVPTEQSKT